MVSELTGTEVQKQVPIIFVFVGQVNEPCRPLIEALVVACKLGLLRVALSALHLQVLTLIGGTGLVHDG